MRTQCKSSPELYCALNINQVAVGGPGTFRERELAGRSGLSGTVNRAAFFLLFLYFYQYKNMIMVERQNPEM